MTIECYYSHCQHHSIHEDPDEGPYCFERECKASEDEILVFREVRRQYLGKALHEDKETI